LASRSDQDCSQCQSGKHDAQFLFKAHAFFQQRQGQQFCDYGIERGHCRRNCQESKGPIFVASKTSEVAAPSSTPAAMACFEIGRTAIPFVNIFAKTKMTSAQKTGQSFDGHDPQTARRISLLEADIETCKSQTSARRCGN
jgi:hypothetical protein